MSLTLIIGFIVGFVLGRLYRKGKVWQANLLFGTLVLVMIAWIGYVLVLLLSE